MSDFCCEVYAKLVAQSNEIIDIIGAEAYRDRLDEWTMRDYEHDGLSQIRRKMYRHECVAEPNNIAKELLKTVVAAGDEKTAQFIREELLNELSEIS